MTPDRHSPLLETAPPPQVQAGKPVHVADQMPVRVIGAPLLPNTNPRERQAIVLR